VKQKIFVLAVMFFYTLVWLMITGWVKSSNIELSQIPLFIGGFGGIGLVWRFLPMRFGKESVSWSFVGFILGVVTYLIITLIWLPAFLLYVST